MAKYRTVNTRFWTDNFISDLNPLDRYLFLYFITNDHTNIIGIYEVPLRTVSFETGIEVDMLKKMLVRLNGKVFYVDGWVFVKNFKKYQAYSNPSVKKGMEVALNDVPAKILNKINGLRHTVTGPDTLSEDPSNIDIDIDSNIDIDVPPLKTPTEIANKKHKEESFEIFYAAYPRKKDRITAKRRFMNLSTKLYPKIMEALELNKRSKQWQDKEFIPFPSTWLNQKRWEDEVEVSNMDPMEVEARALLKQFPSDNDTTAQFRFSKKYGNQNLLRFKHLFNL